MRALAGSSQLRIWRVAPVAAAVVVVGLVAVVLVRAAGPLAAFEPELGNLTPGASSVAVSGASGGKVVKFLAAATPTPSPGSFRANCIVKPSDCGYPDATNTGVPAGTVLRKVPADVTSGPGWNWVAGDGLIYVTGNNAVLEGLDIPGGVNVRANNVTIRKSRIISDGYYPVELVDSYAGLVVEDTEIKGTTTSVTAAISFANYTARRVHVHGTADGFKANSNVVIEDSYIHDLAESAGSHNDGVQSTGGSNVVLRHTTCDTNLAGVCVQFGNGDSNWTITQNLIRASGWSINGANLPNSSITNNRFVKVPGYYGPIGVQATTVSGNYFDDNNAPVN